MIWRVLLRLGAGLGGRGRARVRRAPRV